MSSLCFIILIASICLAEAGTTYPRCATSSGSSEIPTNCRYGMTRDYCGRYECAKGPGEYCRVSFYTGSSGNCGKGTFCGSCKKCIGCSQENFECYENHSCQ